MAEKILIVDDELQMVDLLKIGLEASGYEIITAHDGQEGLEKARKENPDLMILDLMLPKMDGYKVCGLLKNDTRFAKIPIIIFTARAQREDMAIGKDVGADAYITKPFDLQVLLAKITELLKHS